MRKSVTRVFLTAVLSLMLAFSAFSFGACGTKPDITPAVPIEVTAAEQVGGAAGVSSTVAIRLTFNAAVNLTESDLTISGAAGLTANAAITKDGTSKV